MIWSVGESAATGAHSTAVMGEDGRAIAFHVLVEAQAKASFGQHTSKRGLAHFQGTRGGPWSDQGRTFARIERILEEEEDRTDFVRRAAERELKRREAKKGAKRSRS